MVQSLRRLPSDTLSENGLYFFQANPLQLFPAFPVIQIMTATPKRDDEPHFDGGASILHAGLTLWGRRSLRLFLAGPAEEQGKSGSKQGAFNHEGIASVQAEQKPGDIYIGALTAPYHVVHHDGNFCPEEVYNAEKFQRPYKVAVMLRSAAFGGARARSSATPPGPTPVFHAVRNAVYDALAATRLPVPTLAQSHAVFRQPFDVD